jgi:anthranilate synthase component 1
VRYWEKLPAKACCDLDFPDLEMGIYDDGFLYDHVRRQALYYYQEENRLSEVARLLKKPVDHGTLGYAEPKANVSKNASSMPWSKPSNT